MQFQADILGRPVEVAEERETTALGAAALAGLAVGVWSGVEEIADRVRCGARYEPSLDRGEVAERREEWRAAVRRALAR